MEVSVRWPIPGDIGMEPIRGLLETRSFIFYYHGFERRLDSKGKCYLVPII